MQSELTVDSLAQEIRRVDGNHSLGAGALAEALIPFLTAALSDKQAVEVKIKPLEWIEHPSADAWRADTMLGTYQVWAGSLKTGWLFDGLFAERLNETSYDEDAAKAAAQADYEQRIRSALVDVPAVEPVAWLDDGSCRAGSDRTAYRVVTSDQKRDMPAAIAASFTTPLYAHPPLPREGEDSAEVDGLTKALMAAYEEFNRIACEFVTETRSASDALDRCHVFANRGASSIRAALAAMRSGSATTHSGGDHG